MTVRLPLVAGGAGAVKFVAGFAAAVHDVDVGSSVDQASVVELPNGINAAVELPYGIDAAPSVNVGTTKAKSAWMNP